MTTQPSADRDPIALAHAQWHRHGWGRAADGMAMVTSVTRVHQLLTERIDAVLRQHDLTFARYEVLQLLSFSRAGALPMAVVGSRLQVHPASVTSAVARLEQQGLVSRRRDPDDGRVVLAGVTEVGRARVAAATDDLNREVFEQPGVDAADLHTLIGLLGRVRAAGGDTVHPAPWG